MNIVGSRATLQVDIDIGADCADNIVASTKLIIYEPGEPLGSS